LILLLHPLTFLQKHPSTIPQTSLSAADVINHLKYGEKHGVVKGHTPKFVTVEISNMNKQKFFSTAPMTTKPFSQSVIALQLIYN
jgi:hypothetical protein